MKQFKCCAKNSAEADRVEKTYHFLRAIADPNRLKILCILQTGSQCVCEITAKMEISDKLASHHLKQLKKLELLREKREGNFIRYSLNKKIIKDYKKNFNQIII